MAQGAPEWAREYLRIPYAEADCWKLIGRVLQDRAGIDLPTFADEYTADGSPAYWETAEQIIVREQKSPQWVRIPPESPRQVFDVALYWMLCKDGEGVTVRRLSHVGVVITDRHGIGTDERHGSYLYRLDDRIFRDRLESYYRFSPVEGR